jgi:hypothetical protein
MRDWHCWLFAPCIIGACLSACGGVIDSMADGGDLDGGGDGSASACNAMADRI